MYGDFNRIVVQLTQHPVMYKPLSDLTYTECELAYALIRESGQTHYIFYYILLCYFFAILLIINTLSFVYIDCFSYLYKIY